MTTEEIIQLIKYEEIDIDDAINDVTSHYIADAYESMVEAFYYGYNQAIAEILKKITP